MNNRQIIVLFVIQRLLDIYNRNSIKSYQIELKIMLTIVRLRTVENQPCFCSVTKKNLVAKYISR